MAIKNARFIVGDANAACSISVSVVVLFDNC